MCASLRRRPTRRSGFTFPGSDGMKKLLSAALLFLEIAASIWAMDFAFSFMNEPSDIFFWGGLGLLFLVGAFWYYRIQVFRHRRNKTRNEARKIMRKHGYGNYKVWASLWRRFSRPDARRELALETWESRLTWRVLSAAWKTCRSARAGCSTIRRDRRWWSIPPTCRRRNGRTT